MSVERYADAMPRYFFHVVDGDRTQDPEGTALPDDAAAREDAVRLVGEMIRERPDLLWERGQWRVDVADERGSVCWSVVSIALDLRGPAGGAR